MKSFIEFLKEARSKNDTHLTFGGKLGDHCDIGMNMPDADFWLIRKGDSKKVGKPVDEFSPEHIGIKIRNHNIHPTYLKYSMKHLHNKGYFSSRATGVLKLVNIRNSHVEDIPTDKMPYHHMFQNKKIKTNFDNNHENIDKNHLHIYRGENTGNKEGGPMNGAFYSTDREWARQFTQTGQEHEIITKKIKHSDILDKRHVYAGDDIEPHLREAEKLGFKAVRFNEGKGEPDSIYVINHRKNLK